MSATSSSVVQCEIDDVSESVGLPPSPWSRFDGTRLLNEHFLTSSRSTSRGEIFPRRSVAEPDLTTLAEHHVGRRRGRREHRHHSRLYAIEKFARQSDSTSSHHGESILGRGRSHGERESHRVDVRGDPIGVHDGVGRVLPELDHDVFRAEAVSDWNDGE